MIGSKGFLQIFVGFNPVLVYFYSFYPRNLICSHDSTTIEQEWEWMMASLKVNANELQVALQFTLNRRNTSEILVITVNFKY